MKNILITGGAGFIGSNIALNLIRKGYDVTVLDSLSKQIHGTDPEKTSPLYQSIKDKVKFIKVDALANLISATVMQNKVNGIINCCTGKPISLAEQVESFIKEHDLDIKLEYGAFHDRPYDSPCEYGDARKINKIIGGWINEI